MHEHHYDSIFYTNYPDKSIICSNFTINSRTHAETRVMFMNVSEAGITMKHSSPPEHTPGIVAVVLACCRCPFVSLRAPTTETPPFPHCRRERIHTVTPDPFLRFCVRFPREQFDCARRVRNSLLVHEASLEARRNFVKKSMRNLLYHLLDDRVFWSIDFFFSTILALGSEHRVSCNVSSSPILRKVSVTLCVELHDPLLLLLGRLLLVVVCPFRSDFAVHLSTLPCLL